MQNLRRKKSSGCCKKCFLGTFLYILIFVLLVFVVLFVIVPVTFKYSVGIQRSIIFPTWTITPNTNYSDIERFGITGVKNFYVNLQTVDNSTSDGNDNITLGVWQILPTEMLSELIRNEDYNYEGVLQNEKYNILIYLHGNGQDRAADVEKYSILRKNFHILAVDYRGYADSTKAELTETGIVNDVVNFYKWLKMRTKSKIFVWGHSLGTGVGTHMLADLKKENIFSKGLVLEAPFTSVTDVMTVHPLLKCCSWLPWFWGTIMQPMIDNDFDFNSKKYIVDVDSPIMILHAKDDTIIPASFATELYNIAVQSRNYTYQGNVTYHLFESLGYNHMMIYNAPELPEYIEEFMNDTDEFEKKFHK